MKDTRHRPSIKTNLGKGDILPSPIPTVAARQGWVANQFQ